ncbi:MAG: hypothetical protein RI956_525 [Pseudomonadota bacterium]|jgi:hypothetical protein
MKRTTEAISFDNQANLTQVKPCSAYIFGATTHLGDALLNQILANKRYQHIYVSTHTPLPSTTVHLNGFSTSDFFNWQTNLKDIDCFLIAQPSLGMHHISRSGVPRYDYRHAFYSPLYEQDIPELLNKIFNAKQCVNNHTHLNIRYLLIAPNLNATTLNTCLLKYANSIPILTYSDDSQANVIQEQYRFQAQGVGLLDRVGVMLLNTISSSAHLMLHGRQKFILTAAKLAQRLLERFIELPNSHSITHLTRADMVATLK